MGRANGGHGSRQQGALADCVRSTVRYTPIHRMSVRAIQIPAARGGTGHLLSCNSCLDLIPKMAVASPAETSYIATSPIDDDRRSLIIIREHKLFDHRQLDYDMCSMLRTVYEMLGCTIAPCQQAISPSMQTRECLATSQASGVLTDGRSGWLIIPAYQEHCPRAMDPKAFLRSHCALP
ncbi:hypothetical protein BO70DRAFT_79911 [Aspergillus heteromorphus CBS 117.55]|uniref:Uncharacterized protein n=1 Tax=Aspergillus heteromorphus CBS 117.55 TaxID=1448321 RepID=A0A317WZU0_9EURO|nr:uncharacterized protein BO70DRAFT_79911 [Aspergillus heteromorphus CBS 117.55]PWY90842.1 hypothetical protein BO70DRAFT_79911 [Aspergillus heteromorphus CBS 117.55]